jgi:hypothetical protein
MNVFEDLWVHRSPSDYFILGVGGGLVVLSREFQYLEKGEKHWVGLEAG